MVNYNDYISNIKSGDLIAWTTKGFSRYSLLGFIVRIATASEYDHVAIAWWSGGKLFVVEAIPPEVRIYPLSERTPFFHIPMDIVWKNEYTDYLLKRVGEPYSIPEAIRSAFTSPSNNGTWICSELCNRFYKDVGLDFGKNYLPSTLIEAILTKINTTLVVVS